MRFKYYLLIFLLNMLPVFLQAQHYKRMLNDMEFENRIVVHYTTYKVETFVYGGERSVQPDDDKYYSWFAAHDIKITRGGYDGKLLHGEYAAFYNNKNLKEKGWYRLGLKKGVWKNWDISGEYIEVVNWRKGKKNGHYTLYDTSGVKMEEGNYRNDHRSGVVRYFQGGEVVKKKYKDGDEVEIKPLINWRRKAEKQEKGIRIPFIKSKKEKGNNSENITSPKQQKNPPPKGKKEKKSKSNIKVKKSYKVIPLPHDET